MATASALESLGPLRRRDSMAVKMVEMFKRPDAHAAYLTASSFARDIIKVPDLIHQPRRSSAASSFWETQIGADSVRLEGGGWGDRGQYCILSDGPSQGGSGVDKRRRPGVGRSPVDYERRVAGNTTSARRPLGDGEFSPSARVSSGTPRDARLELRANQRRLRPPSGSMTNSHSTTSKPLTAPPNTERSRARTRVERACEWYQDAAREANGGIR